MKTVYIQIFKCLIFFCVITVPVNVLSSDLTWQQQLETQFDIVETFDQLNDWSGGTSHSSNPNDMPTLKDGSISPIWKAYQIDTGVSIPNKWISDQGEDFTLHRSFSSSTPKALCLNDKRYPSAGEPLGYGPGRMIMYIGDGDPTKGYKKIHVMFFVKFNPNAFPKDSNGFIEVNVFKFFEINAGFAGPFRWGTEVEREGTSGYGIMNPTPQPSTGGAWHDDQMLSVYGPNSVLMNIEGYRGSLGFGEYTGVAAWNTDGYPNAWRYTDSDSGIPSSPAYTGRWWNWQDPANVNYINFASLVSSNQWVGMEFAFDLGTGENYEGEIPLGFQDNYDGSIEAWIYDSSGNVISHQKKDKILLLNKYTSHRINKIQWGGNRLGSSYGEDPSDPDDTRYYIDDVIIDDGRIGLKYFQLVNQMGGLPLSKPGAPASSIE